MTKPNRLALAPAMIAAVSLVATPASAASLPAMQTSSASLSQNVATGAGLPDWSDASVTQDFGRFGRFGRYRGRNRIDAGDVLTGILIIGGIAAVASAANSNNRRNRNRDRDYREDRRVEDRRVDDRRTRSSNGSSGLDNAVSLCTAAIERDVRIESVDGVTRNASGWTVTGAIFNGTPFTCQIGPDGEIDRVDYALSSNANQQFDDERYRSARLEADRANVRAEAQAGADQTAGETRLAQALPAYPGGPIDGDLNE
jgi:hypothetical protein